MKTGKITAKLRDAVPVCLMVNGEEVKRYENVELPDELKEVEMTDFHFNVHMDGKITFEIHYEEGALPEVFPEARTRVSRAAKAAAKAAAQESTEVMAVEAAEPVNPMEELNHSIEDLRGKLRTLLDESALLARKVKEAVLQQKQREREFIQAKRAIERIRMAI